MPEGYYRPAMYPSNGEYWLAAAAKDNQLITCRCARCRRVVRYLATDLLPILGPDHRVMTVPPFPCRCGETERIAIKVALPAPGDWGSVEVRRPAGIKRTQLWRTVKLGELVTNVGFGAPEQPLGPKLLRNIKRDELLHAMCNLYSVTTNREAMRRVAQAFNDSIGNMPELPGIYPDYYAPIVRIDRRGDREIVLARWGLPSLKDEPTEKPNRGTTNIRHPWFTDWKGYLGVEHRCLVPVTRFAEPTKLDDGSSGNAWLAIDEGEPLTFFAGLCTRWVGTRRKDEGPMEHLVFGFFTTEPNDVVGAIHPKAMPVILTTEEQRETWLKAPWEQARRLQRPLPNGELQIVHKTALKYLPGVEGVPSGDPLRLSAAMQPSLL